jgi:hypothetical protein
VPFATWTRVRDLITRVDVGAVVLVVGNVVVVVTELEAGEIARTIKKVPPIKSTTMMSTTASDGW